MALYRIAGLTVEMQPRFALTLHRAEPYHIHEGTPDLVLSGGGDEGEEYAALAQSLYEQLLRFDGLLLHASVVELDGRAYAFSAPSGTGKSTHTAFWEQEFGAQIINDDKPAIRLIDGIFYACGTPFSGKHDKSRNVCVPLAGIAFLERAQETFAEPMKPQQALWSLLNQTLRPMDAVVYDRLLTLLDGILKTVPVYRVGCTNEPSAAHIVKQRLHG